MLIGLFAYVTHFCIILYFITAPYSTTYESLCIVSFTLQCISIITFLPVYLVKFYFVDIFNLSDPFGCLNIPTACYHRCLKHSLNNSYDFMNIHELNLSASKLCFWFLSYICAGANFVFLCLAFSLATYTLVSLKGLYLPYRSLVARIKFYGADRAVHIHTEQESLAVASIVRDDTSTLPGDDPFLRAHWTINSSVLATACTAVRSKLGSEFET